MSFLNMFYYRSRRETLSFEIVNPKKRSSTENYEAYYKMVKRQMCFNGIAQKDELYSVSIDGYLFAHKLL
jgi:hypothetical protein